MSNLNTNPTNDFEVQEDVFQKLRTAFIRQRASAKYRGIDFEFTFETWLGLWLSSGHLEERGKASNKYVMARYGDTGPYSPENCFIQTFRENVQEAQCGKPKTRKEKNYAC